MAQTGAASFEPLGAISGVLAAASFEDLAASGVSTSEGSTSATSGSAAKFSFLTASGSGSAGSAAEGDASFEDLTAAGYGPTSASPSFGEMTGTGVSLTGTVASASPRFAAMTAEVENVGGTMSSAAPSFRAMRADAESYEQNTGRASPSFRKPYAQATGAGGTVASASVSFERQTAEAAGYSVVIANGVATFSPIMGRGIGQATLTDSRTWVMNVGNDALTEYHNYDFDGYTYFNGDYYGAGPGGLYKLTGDDDAGADIAWSFRTPLMDDKKPGLKRLEEVLLAMKYDGPVRVRIWTDDNSYFDYNISNFRPGVMQQVRTKTGKGMRSRYFRVEVSGVGNTAAEVLSLQLPMLPINRRLG